MCKGLIKKNEVELNRILVSPTNLEKSPTNKSDDQRVQ